MPNTLPKQVSILRYKTNRNPYSPDRDQTNANSELQIPTEKQTSIIPRYISDFEPQYDLGKGSFGTVIMCINRTDGWCYAVKKLTYQTEKMREKFLQEAYVLAALDHHPFIVRYYGSWEDQLLNTIYIQCEWCKGGSLKKQKENSFVFDQIQLCKIIRHICSALEYMHGMGFSHGDVKPENILVNTREICDQTIYKLGDLGSINDSGDGRYLAPELLSLEDEKEIPPPILAKADIFSLGMTVLELAQAPSSQLEKRSEISEEDIHLPGTFDPYFIGLIKAMLQRGHDLRPSPHQLLVDPLIIDHIEWQLFQDNVILKRRIEELEELLIQAHPSLLTPPTKKKKFFELSSLLSAFTGKPGSEIHPGAHHPNSPPESPLNSDMDSVSDSGDPRMTPPRKESDPDLPGLTTLPADYNNLHAKNYAMAETLHSPYIYGSRLRPPHTHRKFHILRQARSPETPPGTYVKRFIHYSHISNQPEEFMDTDMLYTPTPYEHVDLIYPDTPPSAYRPYGKHSSVFRPEPEIPSVEVTGPAEDRDPRMRERVYYNSRRVLLPVPSQQTTTDIHPQ